jgi:hypothetical protein
VFSFIPYSKSLNKRLESKTLQKGFNKFPQINMLIMLCSRDSGNIRLVVCYFIWLVVYVCCRTSPSKVIQVTAKDKAKAKSKAQAKSEAQAKGEAAKPVKLTRPLI